SISIEVRTLTPSSVISYFLAISTARRTVSRCEICIVKNLDWYFLPIISIVLHIVSGISYNFKSKKIGQSNLLKIEGPVDTNNSNTILMAANLCLKLLINSKFLPSNSGTSQAKIISLSISLLTLEFLCSNSSLYQNYRLI